MKKDNNQLDYLLKFFKVQKPWDVTCAHRVNNLQRLNEYMASSDIMMVEGDIILSKDSKEAVMAHSPETESALTFEKWFSILLENKKGAKYVFKRRPIN